MATVELQSQDHRDLLDIVDNLRSLGLTRYIDLPQIIVCGDQSTGKSSVLEAISGFSFPTKDNLCTRFATELILRRDETPGVKVSIIPGPDRTQEEAFSLSTFHHEVDLAHPDLSSVVDGAKRAMGLSEVKVFSSDTLRVELRGPQQPHLTLVDLPGLFRASNRDQSVDSAPVVQRMVRSYMKKQRSIILAVVSAQSDINLQPVTELSRELDPAGVRTLGLITKPDTLPHGSESEASYVALAQNKDVVFRLGWHVLRNRGFETRHATTVQRDSDERQFFAAGSWAHLDRSTVGIQTLRPRLSEVLRNLILQQLPSLLRDVSNGLEECRQWRTRLGEPRGTVVEQRRYLRQISWRFCLLMRAAVDGFYSNVFFGRASTDVGYQKRLRAVVQNELESFAEAMRFRGRAQIIIEDDEHADDDDSVPRTTRSDYLSHVRTLIRRSRGCELPGTFNPLIIGELFRDQCRPWERIVTHAQDAIVKAVCRTARMILESVALPEVVNAMFFRLNEMIDKRATNASVKNAEMLRTYFYSHAITYNHYLTDTVQKIQSERSRRRGVEVNMEAYTSQLAVDYMQAYYKVAMKRFVDDYSVLVIEEQLMQHLPSLFDTETVDDLSDNDVSSLAAESEATVCDRLSNNEKLCALETAMGELKRLHKSHPDLLDVPLNDVDEETEDSQRNTPPSPRAASPSEFHRQMSDVEAPDVEEWPAAAPFEEEAVEDAEHGGFTSKRSSKKKKKPSAVYAPSWE